jgi:SAM-dependent methyltransferase
MQLVTNEVSRFWDAEAASFDRMYESPGREGRFLRSRHAVALHLVGDPPDPEGRPAELLDVGMGPGRALAELAARGWRVSGVDASKRMVALARRRLPSARERLLQASLERLPFADASFDAVIAIGVLGWVSYGEENVARLARVLRPGALAVVSLPNRRSLHRRWRHRHVFLYPAARAATGIVPLGRPGPPIRPRAPGRRRFEALLERAGLRVESVRYASYFSRRLDALSCDARPWVHRRVERAAPLLADQLVYGVHKR